MANPPLFAMVNHIRRKKGIPSHESHSAQVGISWQTLYNWKVRLKAGGLEALADRSRAPRQPRQRSERLKERVIAQALRHPTQGCVAMATAMSKDGRISKTTIHDILVEAKLSGRRERWLRLEDLYRDDPGAFSCEQYRFLEENNPAHLDREMAIDGPGQVLQLGFVTTPTIKGACQFALCVDGRSGYLLATSLEGDDALAEAAELPERLLKRMNIQRGRETPQLLIRLEKSNPPALKDLERWFAERVSSFSFHLGRCDDAASVGFCGMLIRVQQELRTQSVRRPFIGQKDAKAWLLSWNERDLKGYPNYGASPQSRITSA